MGRPSYRRNPPIFYFTDNNYIVICKRPLNFTDSTDDTIQNRFVHGGILCFEASYAINVSVIELKTILCLAKTNRFPSIGLKIAIVEKIILDLFD